MYVTPEQIQAANKATVEALLAVANTQFTALEKLANIQASAVKSAFEDSVANTARCSARRMCRSSLRCRTHSPSPPSRRPSPTRRASTKSRPRRMRAVESGGAPCREWNENFVTLLDKVSKNAPPARRRGRRGEVDAGRREFGYDNLTKVAKQATEIAEANVAAATETVKASRSQKRPPKRQTARKTNAQSSAKRSRTKAASLKRSKEAPPKAGFSFVGKPPSDTAWRNASIASPTWQVARTPSST